MLEQIANQAGVGFEQPVPGGILKPVRNTGEYAVKAFYGIKKLLGFENIANDNIFSPENYQQFVQSAQGGTEPEVQVYIPLKGLEKSVTDIMESLMSQQYPRKQVIFVSSPNDISGMSIFEKNNHYLPQKSLAEEAAQSQPNVTHVQTSEYQNSMYGRINPEVDKILYEQEHPGIFRRIVTKMQSNKETGGRSLGVTKNNLEKALESLARYRFNGDGKIQSLVNMLDERYSDGKHAASYNTLASVLYRTSTQGNPLQPALKEFLGQVVDLYHTPHFDNDKSRIRRLTSREIVDVLDKQLRDDGYRGKKVTNAAVNQMLHAAEVYGINVDWKRGPKKPVNEWDAHLDHLAKLGNKTDLNDQLKKVKLPDANPADIYFAMIATNGIPKKPEPEGIKTIMTLFGGELADPETGLQQYNWAVNHQKDAIKGKNIVFANNPLYFLGAPN
ncbi:MAG: hypothetical protein AABX51_00520 [Nanoarchaeota archaeon]